MNMGKRFLALALVGLMLVSGCKKNEPKPEVVNDTIQDLGGEVVIKVGDTEMTDNQFKFFLDDIKNQMQGTELSTDEDWENAEIEGRKAIDVAKERAYESAVYCLQIVEIGKKMGITCTDEDKDMVKSMMTAEDVDYFSKYPGGDTIIDFICELNVYMGKIQEEFLNDEKISAYFDEHKDELASEYLRAKHVLFLTQNDTTGEALSETEIAEKKKQADEILNRAKNGEDFDALVSEYSEDPGSHQNPQGYVFTSGEMVPEFENCVKGLGMDEIGFAETSYGYHIIKRLDLDAESCRDVISNKLYAEFEPYIESKISEYNIEIIKNDDEYNNIK